MNTDLVFSWVAMDPGLTPAATDMSVQTTSAKSFTIADVIARQNGTENKQIRNVLIVLNNSSQVTWHCPGCL